MNTICLYVHVYAFMKTMCPPGYHNNDFVAIHAFGHMMYGYILLVPMNQSVLKKLIKERNISGHKWSTTQRVFQSPRSKMVCFFSISIWFLFKPLMCVDYLSDYYWLLNWNEFNIEVKIMFIKIKQSMKCPLMYVGWKFWTKKLRN